MLAVDPRLPLLPERIKVLCARLPEARGSDAMCDAWFGTAQDYMRFSLSQANFAELVAAAMSLVRRAGRSVSWNLMALLVAKCLDPQRAADWFLAEQQLDKLPLDQWAANVERAASVIPAERRAWVVSEMGVAIASVLALLAGLLPSDTHGDEPTLQM